MVRAMSQYSRAGQHTKLLQFGIHLNNIGLFWHHIRVGINWKLNQMNVLEMKFSVVYRTCSTLIHKITRVKQTKIFQIKTWAFMSIFSSSWVSGGWFIWKINGFCFLFIFVYSHWAYGWWFEDAFYNCTTYTHKTVVFIYKKCWFKNISQTWRWCLA